MTTKPKKQKYLSEPAMKGWFGAVKVDYTDHYYEGEPMTRVRSACGQQPMFLEPSLVHHPWKRRCQECMKILEARAKP